MLQKSLRGESENDNDENDDKDDEDSNDENEASIDEDPSDDDSSQQDVSSFVVFRTFEVPFRFGGRTGTSSNTIT